MLPFQLRALREQRGWTQQQLGVRCGKKQEWISKLENPQYAKFTLRTLKTLAQAFDVALQVKFISYDSLIGWLNTRHHGDLRVPSYSEDAALTKRVSTAVSAKVECVRTAHVSGGVLSVISEAVVR
jgi:transcriptional regulator with XRE-family HTH domain